MLPTNENFVISEILDGHRGFVGFLSVIRLSLAIFHDPFISVSRLGIDNFSFVTAKAQVPESSTI
ncbi:hypothetical protein [Flocculibacter collagenilyticus]|uniref:hypothetical protein n=1 Tax=Flocculibacter collagenilyticus TaxID=2744479 RepID=UPI0018F6F741|nr:hypothetical protein [Flocculibacter collagenilyticus]